MMHDFFSFEKFQLLHFKKVNAFNNGRMVFEESGLEQRDEMSTKLGPLGFLEGSSNDYLIFINFRK